MIGVTLCLNGIFFPQKSRICCFFLILSGDVNDMIVNVVTSMLYLCSLRSFWFTDWMHYW